MRSPRRTPIACAAGLLAASGCIGHPVPHVAPDESRPHITWELRAGGHYGDRDFVCGSRQPSRACVLPVSTDQHRTLATLNVYLHAAARQTKYLGLARAPVIESGVENIGEINTSVPPGSKPVAATVTGFVTSKLGEYTLSISLDAIETGMENPVHIARELRVTVKR